MNEQKPLVIMPCLDMINGRVVKGVNFVDIKDAGDPVACCRAYCEAGADELAMLDITATVEGRKTLLETVRKVADAVTVPFTMGGGISSVKAAEEVLAAGADKVSTSSAVFRQPEMIGELVKAFGAEKVTVAIDVAQNAAMPSGYEVFIDGGRTATGTDAIEWAKRVDGFGVRTILPTSKSTDGVRTGYDLPLIRRMREITDADIVASGGAGTLEHFAEAAEAGATVLLAASVFHFHVIGIPELKAFLKARGFAVQICGYVGHNCSLFLCWSGGSFTKDYSKSRADCKGLMHKKFVKNNKIFREIPKNDLIFIDFPCYNGEK